MSYWWPLGRSATAPVASTNSNSQRGSNTPTYPRTPHAATDIRHLAETAFHSSLESLLVESTKHRGLAVLRDAVLSTRQHRYEPSSLFDTLCIACTLLAERCGTGPSRSFSNSSHSPSTASAHGGTSLAVAAGGTTAIGTTSGARGLSRSSSGNALAEMNKMGASITSLPAAMAAAAAGAMTQHGLHYRHHATARALLLQSIGDLGKVIALGLLPVTQPVAQRVADLVREIAFTPGAGARGNRASPLPRAPGATPPPTPRDRSVYIEHEYAEVRNSISSVRAVRLVHDAPVLVRLLQLTASGASACVLGSPALPELYGVLLLFYSGVEPQSMLEATCEATLTHHIHSVLAVLRDCGEGMLDSTTTAAPAAAAAPGTLPHAMESSANNVGSGSNGGGSAHVSLNAQLQGVAFVKDLCRLMVGARTRWLQLAHGHRRNGRTVTTTPTGDALTASSPDERRGSPAVESKSGANAINRRGTTVASSMASVTASVMAEQRHQQQQRQQQQRASRSTSLASTPMVQSLASPTREHSIKPLGSPMAFASAGNHIGNTSVSGIHGQSRRDVFSDPAASSSSLFVASPLCGSLPLTEGPAMECAPPRLRAFLMRAVTLFFKEQETFMAAPNTAIVAATSASPAGGVVSSSPLPAVDATDDHLTRHSPLYLQCLNDAIFSVALWGMYEMDITVSMQPPPSLFVEVMQQQGAASQSGFVCTLELFTYTQQLALVAMSSNLHGMANAVQVLLESHERLLQRLYRRERRHGTSRSPVQADESDVTHNGETSVSVSPLPVGGDAYAERLTQAAIAVLGLWRKTLTSTSLLWALLQLRAVRNEDAAASAVVVEAGGTSTVRSTPAGGTTRSSSFFGEEEPSTSENSSNTGHGSGSSTPRVNDSSRSVSENAVSTNLEAAQEMLGTAMAHPLGVSCPLGSEEESSPLCRTGPRSTQGVALAADRETEKNSRRSLLRRPQPLSLARPRRSTNADDFENGQDEEDEDNGRRGGSGEELPRLSTGSPTGGQNVTSPKASMPPLTRLMVAVLSLVMTYVQPPRRHTSASLSVGGTGTTEANASHPNLSAEGSRAAPLCSTSSTVARRRSRRLPPRYLCLSASPATVYQSLTAALSFVTVFGQYFSRLVERQDRGSDGLVRRRCDACLRLLHPYLFRCSAICLRHLLYEEELLPLVLKAVGYWVQVSCTLQMDRHRDAYLSVLLYALMLPDPVVRHLAALSPPSSNFPEGKGGEAAAARRVRLLEALLVVHAQYAARDLVVPGSVAAAAMAGEDEGSGDHIGAGRGTKGKGVTVSCNGRRQRSGGDDASAMSSWGVNWLQRRGMGGGGDPAAATNTQRNHHSSDNIVTPATTTPASPTDAPSTWRKESVGGRVDVASTRAAEARAPARTTTAPKQSGNTPPLAPAASPFTLAAPRLRSGGWRAPSVQHVVVLAFCRLQHKLLVMKTLHVIANATEAELRGGWALLARGLAVTEPLLHLLTRLLPWIEESSVEEGQQAQLMSEALHLRDALRALCVDAACRLPYAQFHLFFTALLDGTAALEEEEQHPLLELRCASSPSLSSSSYSHSAFLSRSDTIMAAIARETGVSMLRPGESIPLSQLEMQCGLPRFELFASDAHLPLHDSQGCADQWVRTSECVCVAMLSLLPFALVPDAEAADSGAAAAKKARAGAILRACLLWKLEDVLCRTLADPQRIAQWGTALATTTAQHKLALLTRVGSVAETQVVNTISSTRTGVTPARASPLDGVQEKTTGIASTAQQQQQRVTPVATSASLSEEDTRAMEHTVSLVLGHVAAVVAHMCRRKSHPVQGSTVSYQAVQASALIVTAGPFAVAPLVQVANALFSGAANEGKAHNTAATPSKIDSRELYPLLPGAQADATVSLATLQRVVQQLLTHRSRPPTATAAANWRADPVVGQETGRRIIEADKGEEETAAQAPLEGLLANLMALLDDVYCLWSLGLGEAATHRTDVAQSAAPSDTTMSPLHPAPDTTNGASLHKSNPLLQPSAQDDKTATTSMRTASQQPPLPLTDTVAAALVVRAALPQLLHNAAAAVLMDVVKLVHAYGDGINGAVWESILSLLQRTAMAPAVEHDRVDSVLTDPSFPAIVTAADAAADGARSDARAGAMRVQAVESLNTAFRTLESIQHNHIPRLTGRSLLQLVLAIGAFAVHRVDAGVPGERKLHINLSAVQLLWSTADYLATFAGTKEDNTDTNGMDDSQSGLMDADSSSGIGPSHPRASNEAAQLQDRLWCALLWQLGAGCIDDRQEVRQSSLQTFFALVQTYGRRFSAQCWRSALVDVLQPLLKVTAAATIQCAIPNPLTQNTSVDKIAEEINPGSPASAEDTKLTSPTGLPAAANASLSSFPSPLALSSVLARRLLRHYLRNTVEVEETRVTLLEAGSRLFVTHYANMTSVTHRKDSGHSVEEGAAMEMGDADEMEKNSDEAVRVLDDLLRLCGDVCVVVRGSSGEASAVAAVHAVHGLLVEMPAPGLPRQAVDAAWRVMERLLFRGDYPAGSEPNPYTHTAAAQCTLNVVSAVVAAVCDSFRLQRQVSADVKVTGDHEGVASDGNAFTSRTSELDRTGGGGGMSAYLSSWSSTRSSPKAVHRDVVVLHDTTAEYFTRLLCVLQTVTRCAAVVNSYYYPCKPQTTLLEGVTAVWPVLTLREARMLWGEVLLPSFPATQDLQRFVAQSGSGSEMWTEEMVVPLTLKAVLPPGSHPSYLSALMGTMRGLLLLHMGIDLDGASTAHGYLEEDAEEGKEKDAGGVHAISSLLSVAHASPALESAVHHDEDRRRLAFMAPSTVHVTGALLLLHLASVEVLAGPRSTGGGSLPFTLPPLFLQECADLLQFTMWGPVLARGTSTAANSAEDGETNTAGLQGSAPCSHDGVAALCRVFQDLLSSTAALVRRLDTDARARNSMDAVSPAPVSPTTSITTTTVPPYLTAALQVLDRLVDTLGEVVQLVMAQYEDVVTATEVITALSVASTADGLALARVAKRSLVLLRRWGEVLVVASPQATPPQRQQQTSSYSHGATPPERNARAGDYVVLSRNARGSTDASGSRSQLQDVVRASLETRNRAIVKQFLGSPDDTGAAALLVDTLRDLRLAVEIEAHQGQTSEEAPWSPSQQRGHDAASALDALVPDLLRLVSACSASLSRTAAAVAQEREMREMLAVLLAAAYRNATHRRREEGSAARAAPTERRRPVAGSESAGDTAFI